MFPLHLSKPKLCSLEEEKTTTQDSDLGFLDADRRNKYGVLCPSHLHPTTPRGWQLANGWPHLRVYYILI